MSKSYCAPPQVCMTFDKKAEAILDRCNEGIGRHEQNTFYHVHWEGQPPEEATWEKYTMLWQFEDQLPSSQIQCRRGRR